jgi:shikimate kinase
MMRTVFLIGYMGCGKTTLGEPLARLLGWRFVDLDLLIEEKEGMTAKEIFQNRGEAHFRELERAALEEVAACGGDVIVACGGGTPLQAGNMELMNRVGITVWLRTSVERIVSRLVQPEQRSKRPLLNNMSDEEIKESVKKGLKARNKYYKKAQLQFDSTYLESEEEINDTTSRLAQLLMHNSGISE